MDAPYHNSKIIVQLEIELSLAQAKLNIKKMLSHAPTLFDQFHA